MDRPVAPANDAAEPILIASSNHRDLDGQKGGPAGSAGGPPIEAHAVIIAAAMPRQRAAGSIGKPSSADRQWRRRLRRLKL
jgi:hypothetical protein